MALYLFPSPQIVRQSRALEERPVLSLWTRVKRDIPTTLLRRADGTTWEEWIDAWPQTRSPRNQVLFGPHGFNTMGSDQSGFEAATRLYIGGHSYIISDTLRSELLAASTQAQPNGYGDFIVPAPPGAVYTGDEIILSGFADGFGKPATV